MSLRSDLEKLAYEHWCNDHVKIKPISTQDDLIYAGYYCQLTEEQKELVNPFWFSIGRAYLYRDDYYPCNIYNAEGEPIGFICFCKWQGNGEAYSWSYFIDKNHQGKGYGRHSAQLATDILKASSIEKTIKLATEISNVKAQRLYESLGFERLSEMDGDDIVYGL
jgi:diamine N-acetyltransferase